MIDDMLQVANDVLSQLGVELAERDKYLNIIQRRLAISETGAKWTQDPSRYLRKK